MYDCNSVQSTYTTPDSKNIKHDIVYMYPIILFTLLHNTCQIDIKIEHAA